ncbi:hypothetical protein EG328_004119 [Venturia inaequalis]|uniref:Uncharacterized protein n=1 Tax=Venturia inaequalis TaxID=5025 RepID=A0A8H3VBT8_VENIN|nr:hypothetical protein EG328_004119 [Venturia inaequalis]
MIAPLRIRSSEKQREMVQKSDILLPLLPLVHPCFRLPASPRPTERFASYHKKPVKDDILMFPAEQWRRYEMTLEQEIESHENTRRNLETEFKRRCRAEFDLQEQRNRADKIEKALREALESNSELQDHMNVLFNCKDLGKYGVTKSIGPMLLRSSTIESEEGIIMEHSG